VQPTQWPIEDVSDLVLLLLRANSEQHRSTLAGTTRLQKLLFLLSRDGRYESLEHAGLAPALDFRPYKMGPFNPRVYDALETLATFRPPLVESTSPIGAADDLELARFVDDVDLDDVETSSTLPPRPVEYRLTPDGQQVAEALSKGSPPALRTAIEEIADEFGAMPLRDLLRRVYTEHADMTTKSEIREQLGLG
jgi:hypothetical protein